MESASGRRTTSVSEHQQAGGGRAGACPLPDLRIGPHLAVYRTDVVDLEYFVDPPRAFVIQKCVRCESEFLDPRPTESELPPFYPE